VKVAGTSGGSVPTWSTTIGGTTTDGGITWECIGTGNQLPVLFGWNYAYGYHSSGATNHLSTMSPQLYVNAPIMGTGVQITATGSDDTQVDRDDLYRTADGGSSLLLFNQSTTNVGASTSWTINDSTADRGLTSCCWACCHANDPPPAGGTTIINYYMGRMWMVWVTCCTSVQGLIVSTVMVTKRGPRPTSFHLATPSQASTQPHRGWCY
jgi:hypothetical protein